MGLTLRGFEGLRDVSGAVTVAGSSLVSSVNPAQDLCELLQMAAVTVEEQVLTPNQS